jgi:transposase
MHQVGADGAARLLPPLLLIALEDCMAVYLGIDVAKDTLVVALLGPATPRTKTFPNTPAGHQALLEWLAKQHVQDIQVCLEATGTYGEAIALALYEAGYRVSVVNPARIAAYARSRLARNKTDAADAHLIAQFAQGEQLPAWAPPEPTVRLLRGLVRQLDSLQEQRQAELNRRDAGGLPDVVRELIEAHCAFLDQQIAAVLKQIEAHLDEHPELRQQHDLLTSIPGVGSRTAVRILAEAGDLRQFADARSLAAYAGLTPWQYTSGTSVQGRTRLSRVGNAALRRALYMPAIVAKRHNPVVRAFCERLLARGFAPKAVVGAAMRKLLHIAYGVIKHQRAFDPALAGMS